MKKLLWIVLFHLIFYSPFLPALDDTGAIEGGNEGGVVRGLVKPVQRAIISSQISARITSIPYLAGDSFKKGDLLVSFDCAFYQADLASVDAEYKSKQKILENNKQLMALNAMSEIDVAISESEVEIAQAERRMRAIKVEQCKIKAPYTGRVIDVMANEHETVPADKELLSILNDQSLEIELIVPSNWLNWLKVNQPFAFLVDETGKEFKAKITKIGAAVDPVSQTVKLTGSFDEETPNVLAGMSGAANFEGPVQ